MNSWLVRPNPIQKDRMKEFLDKGIIAIGWPRIPNLLSKGKPEIKELLLQEYPEKYTNNSTTLGNITTIVDAFVNQMDFGHYVVVPHGDDIYVGKIIGKYQYDATKANEVEGYPHQRKTEWLVGPISRDDLPQDLRSSLRAQMTIVNLRHRQAQIDLLLGIGAVMSVPMEQEVIVGGIGDLLGDALKVLQAELESEDPDRRLKAALAVMKLKKDGVIE